MGINDAGNKLQCSSFALATSSAAGSGCTRTKPLIKYKMNGRCSFLFLVRRWATGSPLALLLHLPVLFLETDGVHPQGHQKYINLELRQRSLELGDRESDGHLEIQFILPIILQFKFHTRPLLLGTSSQMNADNAKYVAPLISAPLAKYTTHVVTCNTREQCDRTRTWVRSDSFASSREWWCYPRGITGMAINKFSPRTQKPAGHRAAAALKTESGKGS